MITNYKRDRIEGNKITFDVEHKDIKASFIIYLVLGKVGVEKHVEDILLYTISCSRQNRIEFNVEQLHKNLWFYLEFLEYEVMGIEISEITYANNKKID
jgi:hypothetical protein